MYKGDSTVMGKTHGVFGFLVGLLFIPILKPGNQLLFMACVFVGAYLPDIDHPESKIGRYVKPIGILFEHRGFFHSLLALALVFFLPYYFISKTVIAYGFALGYASHLVGDAITVKGIMPFHPFSRWNVRGIMRTDSFVEDLLFVLFVLVAAWKLYTL